MLDPVLGKLTVKRGRAMVMKIGEAEVEYDPNFRCAAAGGGCFPTCLAQLAVLAVTLCCRAFAIEHQAWAAAVTHAYTRRFTK